MTFYLSAIVNIALSCTVLSYLTLNNTVALKSGLEVTQDHYGLPIVYGRPYCNDAKEGVGDITPPKLNQGG